VSYNPGITAAASSFVMWGLLPIYWKQLDTVPAYEILGHRMAWSFVVTFVLLAMMGKLGTLRALFQQRKQCLYFFFTGSILGVNWFIYIWAVNAGYIIEASLGYFINPLVSVCFGVIFLKEKIRKVQWISIVLAFIGVCYLTWLYGEFPWIAISLASTFACYSLLRKVTTVPALEGLCLETSILLIPALAFLVFQESVAHGAFFHGKVLTPLFLGGTGIATTVPLLCFCYAAQRIPLYVVGLLQYLAPTISLFVGIFLYNESFPPEKMVGFSIIWLALGVFVLDGFSRQLRSRYLKMQLKNL
jgi:chloramphenicol-sensitive protein RarD